MGFTEYFYDDGRVLGIMLCNIKFELWRYFLRVDSCRNPILPFVQHGQDGVVHIVVNEDNTSLRTLDETADKLICVVYLTIEEDALDGRQ